MPCPERQQTTTGSRDEWKWTHTSHKEKLTPSLCWGWGKEGSTSPSPLCGGAGWGSAGRGPGCSQTLLGPARTRNPRVGWANWLAGWRWRCRGSLSGPTRSRSLHGSFRVAARGQTLHVYVRDGQVVGKVCVRVVDGRGLRQSLAKRGLLAQRFGQGHRIAVAVAGIQALPESVHYPDLKPPQTSLHAAASRPLTSSTCHLHIVMASHMHT